MCVLFPTNTHVSPILKFDFCPWIFPFRIKRNLIIKRYWLIKSVPSLNSSSCWPFNFDKDSSWSLGLFTCEMEIMVMLLIYFFSFMEIRFIMGLTEPILPLLIWILVSYWVHCPLLMSVTCYSTVTDKLLAYVTSILCLVLILYL